MRTVAATLTLGLAASPSIYYRDMGASLKNLTQHEMWVALEAGSGITSEHDYDPNSYCAGFNGCWKCNLTDNATAPRGAEPCPGPGAWWNVT